MAVEIRELIVRANLVEDESVESAKQLDVEALRDELLAACEAMIREAIDGERER
ncbi:DUF5908 family protein [Thiocapsa marina]|uniref:Uncharacterized protein n=1 Tax=Thiocapsa marina 5811 TaxID=768671 RepID=F9U9L1_9GAMM|nr:DUF5908 family protein [Thiocapsa marina]EGV18809.1 hypothetical protein ThimaDRAFT_1613 [Thiocapsa marina 5811]